MKAARRRKTGPSIKALLLDHKRELENIVQNAVARAVPNRLYDQARSEREVICRDSAQVLLTYARHLKGCPWTSPRTKGRCNCGLHVALARLLPQERRCDKCRHPIGFHIQRGQFGEDVYCIAPLTGRMCRCKKYPIARP